MGSVLIIVSDEQFERERDKMSRKKNKIFNWPDWLVSDSDKNGGWLFGSIQSEKKMLGKRKRKKNKEVLWFVVVVFYHHLLYRLCEGLTVRHPKKSYYTHRE
jgi:hypothetical protein